MTYSFNNGFRYRSSGNGYHIHKHISERLGKGSSYSIDIHVDTKVQAGTFIPLNSRMTKINSVTLNRHKIQPIIDYVIKNDSIAFTFSVRQGEAITIEGSI